MKPNKKFSIFILVLIALSVIIIPSLAAVLFVNLEADIVPGDDSSYPQELTVYNGELVFSAYDDTHGHEFWHFNGITAELIEDFNPGAANAAEPDGGTPLTEYNGNLYFRCNDATGGRLCRYNGTDIIALDVAPISPVIPINPGSHGFAVYEGYLYFSGLASGTAIGRQMYRYSDTAGTIEQVSTDVGDGNGFSPNWMTVYNGQLYFSAISQVSGSTELWRCDVCAGSDYFITGEINPTGGSQPTKLTVFNGNLLFIANDGTNGFELWNYNSITTVAAMVDVVIPGVGINPVGNAFDVSETAKVFRSAVYNGNLYYMANDGSLGNELWDYDGTSASLVKDINTGPGSSTISHPVYFNGELYFTANDGSLPADMLFSYDGTDANPAFDPVNPPWGTYPAYTTVYDGKLFAGAYYKYGAGAGDNNGYELVSFSLTADNGDDDVDTNDIDLPATGFAPGIVTELPQQTFDNKYSDLGSLWLEIPALDVEASIMGVPVREEGWDLRWLSNQVGWLEGTAFPTWAGNSALTAHVYDSNGNPGPFKDLNTLKWGDEITVHFYGQEYTYEVREVDEYIRPDDNRSVLTHEELPYLTLITCQGYDEESDSYRWRIAVRAVQTKID